MLTLILKPGGFLDRKKWNTETREFDISDVTDVFFRYLADPIEFEKGLTLRDVFLFFNKNLDMIDMIFGNWVKEYTHSALNVEPDKISENLDSLRLYFTADIFKNEFQMGSWPKLDALGVDDEDDKYHPPGEIIKWAIDFICVQNLVHLPIEIDNKITIHNMDSNEFLEYEYNDCSQFSVLQGIIWELSFYGSPKNTQSKKCSMEDTMKRIESGEEKTYLWEDLLDGLEDNEQN